MGSLIAHAACARRYVFDMARGQQRGATPPASQNVIVPPHVRMLGPDHALIAYVRVTQSGDKISTSNETRVWKRVGGAWKNVHFHRSKL